MDKASADTLIIENMVLAERIGQKYAHRNNRYVPESVAEAYFWLVSFFYVDYRLYHANPDDYKRMLGMYIKRNIIRYFEKRGYLENTPLQDKIIRNTDEEMIDFLSEIMSDDAAFKVFHYLRNGINLFEVELVEPNLIEICKKLRRRVNARLERIKALKAAGIKVSRDIIGDSDDLPMEDEESEPGRTSSDSGIPGGREDTTSAPGKQGESEIGSTVAA